MIRVQRKRTKGYKSPQKTKFCGRTAGENPYSNPYRIKEISPGKYILENTKSGIKGITIHTSKETAAKTAVQWFAFYLNRKYPTKQEMKTFLEPLRQYDYLSCWCRKDAAHCHVDYLISMINRFWPEETKDRTKSTESVRLCRSPRFINDRFRYCERHKGHPGKHGAVYCGKWRYWEN